MRTVTKSKTQGFTLIEVVLVLAIAGLIFLIVFLALPALQRSQRDTQRRNDLSRLVSQATNYQSNHQGSLPNGTNEWNGNAFKGSYLTNNQSFKDPSTGEDYQISQDQRPADGIPSVAEGQIRVYIDTKCGGPGVEDADGNRNFAAVIHQEQGGFYCQNN